jgi:3-dehydrosphinganine reductase
MAQDGTRGKIIFVSSLLGYMSFAGYSTYSPAKFALRGKSSISLVNLSPSYHGQGLAEALRSELQLYKIDVHICFPATILSPGYDEENKTKPKITLKIEEADEGLTPEAVAEKLLDGEHYQCSSSLCF